MNRPRYMPPDAYVDDPAEKIDPEERLEDDSKHVGSLASDVMRRIFERITRKGSLTHRALRSDVVLLYVSPHYLPCKRPSAAWLAQTHGVSRQRVSELGREFALFLGEHIQFRGQRFLNGRHGAKKANSQAIQPASCPSAYKVR